MYFLVPLHFLSVFMCPCWITQQNKSVYILSLFSFCLSSKHFFVQCHSVKKTFKKCSKLLKKCSKVISSFTSAIPGHSQNTVTALMVFFLSNDFLIAFVSYFSVNCNNLNKYGVHSTLNLQPDIQEFGGSKFFFVFGMFLLNIK